MYKLDNILQYSSGICNPNKPSSFSPSRTSLDIVASLSILAESTKCANEN